MALLTMREVADKVGMRYSQVKHWARPGILPLYRIGHRLFVDEDEFAEFMRRARVGPDYRKAQ